MEPYKSKDVIPIVAKMNNRVLIGGRTVSEKDFEILVKNIKKLLIKAGWLPPANTR